MKYKRKPLPIADGTAFLKTLDQANQQHLKRDY